MQLVKVVLVGAIAVARSDDLTLSESCNPKKGNEGCAQYDDTPVCSVQEGKCRSVSTTGCVDDNDCKYDQPEEASAHCVIRKEGEKQTSTCRSCQGSNEEDECAESSDLCRDSTQCMSDCVSSGTFCGNDTGLCLGDTECEGGSCQCLM